MITFEFTKENKLTFRLETTTQKGVVTVDHYTTLTKT